MTYLDIKNTLEAIAKQEAETTIEGHIAYNSLNYDTDDCTTYIKSIIDQEISIAMAVSFFQHSDVGKFYTTYKKDIHIKQQKYGITNEDLISFKGDSMYNLCWIVIEETAIHMAKELGIKT